MTDRALNRELLVPGSEERAALPLYQATGENMELASAAWAFGHGMTILELNNRFPPDVDVDAAWERGIAAFRPDATTESAPPRPENPATRRLGRKGKVESPLSVKDARELTA